MSAFWRKCRIALRWTRYTVWLVVVLALLLIAWCNVVGIPEFFQSRIATALRGHGVAVEFSALRWRFIRGIVAENVILGDKLNRADKPLLTARQIQLRFDYPSLAKGKFIITAVVLRDGIFTLPVNATNRLVLQAIQTEVRFLPGETLALDELRAEFSGAKILLAGEVAHAPEVMKWELFAGKKSGGSGRRALDQPLQNFTDALAKIHFTGAPQINVQIAGDASDVHSISVRLNTTAPQVTTPWFTARGLQAAANFSAPEILATNFNPTLDFWTNAVPFHFAWTLRATELGWKNISATTAECAGEWRAPLLAVQRLTGKIGGGTLNATAQLDIATRGLVFTNHSAFDLHLLQPFLPAAVGAQLNEVFWTQPPLLAVDGTLTLPAWTNRAPDWLAVASANARLHGTFAATNAVVRGRTVELARSDFFYARSIWSLPELQLQQGRTRLAGGGEFSAASENFRATLQGALDFETMQSFLPTNVARIAAIYFRPNEPIFLNLAAAGRGLDVDALNATGHLAITNFSAREQTYDNIGADMLFTNRALMFLSPHAERAHGTQAAQADSVTLDFGAWMIFFTNATSTMDPMAVVRVIGPKVTRMIEPYEFLVPPTARTHGQLPLRDINRGRDLDGTDLTFEILQPAQFRWTKLQTTNITGTVRWMGQDLLLTNLAGTFYGGKATGGAYFDFRPTNYGCNFNFQVTATNVDVRLLGYDLSQSKSNLIEGVLSGRAVVTDGNSDSWRSWNGYGAAELRNGVLWNVPVFGILSQALNTVAAGLGNNRATEATAQFEMTNGVARSDSLRIRTSAMELQYIGTVDLTGSVNAHVTALLLRNTPMIGSVVSTVLWPVSKIFECQVGGRVTEPKVTPILFPFGKYLLNPLRTFDLVLPDKPKG
jgi:hypothetical protein